MSNTVTELRDAIVQLDEDNAINLVNVALNEGTKPKIILEEGIIEGLKIIGDKFSSGEYFLLELSEGGKLSDRCIAMVKPLLGEDSQDAKKKAKILLATVKGDLHDIGKNLVAMQMTLGNYDVVDIGIDQDSLDIIRKAEEVNADVIALSALLVTTMENQKEVIHVLKDKGVRDKFKVIIGGGPTSQQFADQIGADGWAEDAVSSVRLLDELLKI